MCSHSASRNYTWKNGSFGGWPVHRKVLGEMILVLLHKIYATRPGLHIFILSEFFFCGVHLLSNCAKPQGKPSHWPRVVSVRFHVFGRLLLRMTAFARISSTIAYNCRHFATKIPLKKGPKSATEAHNCRRLRANSGEWPQARIWETAFRLSRK